MKYKSIKSPFFIIIFGLVIALLGYSLYLTLLEEKSLGVQITLIALVSVVSAFLIWLLLDTYYTITDTKICWKSAFLSGTVDIASIESIQKRVNMWSGLKPATGLKGVIINYSKGKRIYFSPERQDEFVGELVKINSKIAIN